MFLPAWNVVLAAGAVACVPPDRPFLAEILYDPGGSDTGYEFVELLNPLAADVPLAGLRIEAGDGAGAGRWTLRWTAGDADTIRAHARFVVGGDQMTPAPDALATLALQNGPDAVRLVWPDGVTEIVGYGELEFAEYFCGAPATDAPSGLSLARVPDDAALGSNALDFQPMPPSPGRANQAQHDALVEPGSVIVDPERPVPNTPARVHVIVRNGGRTDIESGALRLIVESDAGAVLESVVSAAMGAGESAQVDADLGPLPAGKHTLRVCVAWALDETPENDCDSVRVRVGPGPFELTEIQFHPAGGEGEWVELVNRAGVTLAPIGFTLGDRTTTTGTPRDGAGGVAPDSLVVFAQHRDDLLARFPVLDAARVWEVAPWPALNNSDDATGVADVVVVREADGTLSDRVPYSAAGIPTGVPIERRADAWWPALRPEGSPLAAPGDPVSLSGVMAIVPRYVRDPLAPVRLMWDLPWSGGRATLEVYDLAGRRVARPFVDVAVPARGERAWRVADLAPGVYVVVLRVRQSGAGERLTASVSLRVAGSVP